MNARRPLITFLLAVGAMVVSACGGDSFVATSLGDDSGAAVSGRDELTEILEHVNTHVTDFGGDWQQRGEVFIEGGPPQWDSGCETFDRLGDTFGSAMTTVWESDRGRITHITDDLNFSAGEFVRGFVEIPARCGEVELAGGVVASSSFDEIELFDFARMPLLVSDPNALLEVIELDAYPIPTAEPATPVPDFEFGTRTWIVVATRQNVVSQLHFAPSGDVGTDELLRLVEIQLNTLAGTVPDAEGSFSPPQLPATVAAGTATDVQLVLNPECRNGGTLEAAGAQWVPAESAPFEWLGREVVRGNLVTDGTINATFISVEDEGAESFSLLVTTGATDDFCAAWEQPESSDRSEPENVIGSLDCRDRPIIEDRLDNDGRDPLDVVTVFAPNVVTVEPAQPLFWDAFDADGNIVATLAMGDDDLGNWQIWTCG